MGPANLLQGAVTGADGAWLRVDVGGQDFLIGARGARTGATITFSLRPESLRPVAPGAPPPVGWARLTARLEYVEFLGALTRMDLQLADGTKLPVAALGLPQGWV